MMNSKALKKQLAAAIAMVVVAGVALSSSTYAWFVNNTQVTATSVSVTAQTAYSLRISDGEKTGFGTTTELETTLTELRPASTVNLSDFFKSDAWDGDGNVKTFTGLTDATEAEGIYKDASDATYVYYDKVYLLAGQESTIYLDKTLTGIGLNTDGNDTTIQFNAGTDGGLTDEQVALLKMMRIGLKVTQSTDDGATTSETRTYVYQLDDTVDKTTTVNNKDYVTTIGAADGIVKATSAVNAVDTVQFTNSTSGVPVMADCMVAGNATGLVSYDADKSIATMNANETMMVEIYIWMEGCDFNCTSANAQSFNNTGDVIVENLQLGFCAGATS